MLENINYIPNSHAFVKVELITGSGKQRIDPQLKYPSQRSMTVIGDQNARIFLASDF